MTKKKMATMPGVTGTLISLAYTVKNDGVGGGGGGGAGGGRRIKIFHTC